MYTNARRPRVEITCLAFSSAIMAGHFSLVLVVLSKQEWDEGAVFAVRLFDYDKEGRGEGGSLVTQYDNTTLSVAPWVFAL